MSQTGSSDEKEENMQNCTHTETPKLTRQMIRDNWEHDRQPGWEYYSPENNIHDESVEDSDLTQVALSQLEKFTPDFNQETLVPATPTKEASVPSTFSFETLVSSSLSIGCTQKKRTRDEEEMEEMTEILKNKGFTAFTHKMQGTNRTMMLAFKIYTPGDEQFCE